MDGRVLSYSAILGGGNIHEYKSAKLWYRKYWYTNNLTEELTRKFHKTQRRDDIVTFDNPAYHKVAEYLFRETDNHPFFIGLSVEDIVKKVDIDKNIIDQMCKKDLLQRGFYKPKEEEKFLFWKLRGKDEIEVVFPTRRLVGAYFVRKERSGEAREISSKEVKRIKIK